MKVYLLLCLMLVALASTVFAGPIRTGVCPTGYIRVDNHCLPEDDADDI